MVKFNVLIQAYQHLKSTQRNGLVFRFGAAEKCTLIEINN